MTKWAVKRATIYIGIDPGTETGIAIWNSGTKQFELIKTVAIHVAMAIVKEQFAIHGTNLTVRFEDARLWTHHRSTDMARLQGAGSVKRDASMWDDFLTDMKIPFTKAKPNNKLTKLNKEQFFMITKYSGLTSNHGRDAAMLVYDM